MPDSSLVCKLGPISILKMCKSARNVGKYAKGEKLSLNIDLCEQRGRGFSKGKLMRKIPTDVSSHWKWPYNFTHCCLYFSRKTMHSTDNLSGKQEGLFTLQDCV